MTQPLVSKASVSLPHVTVLTVGNLYVADSDFRTRTRHGDDSQVLAELV